MKSKLLLLFFVLLLVPVYATFAQEEETEEPTTTISKADQKKAQKEAAQAAQKAKQTPPANAIKNTATPPAAKPDVATPPVNSGSGEEDVPSPGKTKPAAIVTTGGTIGTVSPNKSTDPSTQYVLDSIHQGQLNLYRPKQDTDWVATKNIPQARDYIAGANPYSAKPRNMWELGINFGVPMLSGDIPSRAFIFNNKKQSFGFGVSLRKSLGYVMSLRGELNHGTTYGYGWKGTQAIVNNRALTGGYDKAVNYYPTTYGQPGIMFLNYKMTYTQALGQMLFNFNNIKFHKERTNISLYGLVGTGLFYYNTRINQLNDNASGAMYDYSIIVKEGTYEKRKSTEKQLLSLWDNTYESQAEQDITFNNTGSKDPNLVSDKYRNRVDVIANLGMGLSFRLSRKISIGIETVNTFTGDDLIDGQRWSEHPVNDPSLTSRPDNLNYSKIILNYTIGKKSAEPLWWLNPIDLPIVELNEAKNRLAKIPEFTDGDDDGVIDILDREPNTPEGCPVDTHGVQLDSDKDGIPDCRDKEPFSIPGIPVDKDGVGIKKDRNSELNIDSILANFKPAQANFPGWYLPMVHFDLDKDFVKPDYYPELYHIAQVMKMYPKMKVYVDGHTDIRNSNNYNEDLSRRRAINVRNFMIKNYGIEEDRLMLRYLGETTNLIKDLPDRFDARYEREQYMNRRVEFTVDPESMK